MSKFLMTTFGGKDLGLMWLSLPLKRNLVPGSRKVVVLQGSPDQASPGSRRDADHGLSLLALTGGHSCSATAGAPRLPGTCRSVFPTFKERRGLGGPRAARREGTAASQARRMFNLCV